MNDFDIARGSAWIVVALYVAALVLEIRGKSERAVKIVWLLGALSLAAHVAWTMFVAHGGSFWAAYEHTAGQTERVVGFRFGGGVVINLMMLAVWIADASAWLMWKPWGAIRKRISPYLHAVFLFLFFNATIVFGGIVAKGIGIVAALLILAAWRSRLAATR